jgi:hypothetical protein
MDNHSLCTNIIDRKVERGKSSEFLRATRQRMSRESDRPAKFENNE